MTLHFHTYHSGAEVHIDPSTKTELIRYRHDSKRTLASRSTFRRNLIRAHLASILNRLTLPNSSVSLLIGTGALLAAHTFA